MVGLHSLHGQAVLQLLRGGEGAVVTQLHRLHVLGFPWPARRRATVPDLGPAPSLPLVSVLMVVMKLLRRMATLVSPLWRRLLLPV